MQITELDDKCTHIILRQKGHTSDITRDIKCITQLWSTMFWETIATFWFNTMRQCKSFIKCKDGKFYKLKFTEYEDVEIEMYAVLDNDSFAFSSVVKRKRLLTGH